MLGSFQSQCCFKYCFIIICEPHINLSSSHRRKIQVMLQDGRRILIACVSDSRICWTLLLMSGKLAL